MKVCVLQTDNRPTLDYVQLSKQINTMMANVLNYDYHFIDFGNDRENPKLAKIPIVYNFLMNNNYDIVVFMDTDAWIFEPFHLSKLINILYNDLNKHGMYSRDVLNKNSTFINSGGFIIKNNDYIKNMYSTMIEQTTHNYHKKTKFNDQYYISRYVFNNQNNFYVLKYNIINYPTGTIIRHNWNKNKNMYDGMNRTLNKNINDYNSPFIFNELIDDAPYNGYIDLLFD